MWPTWKSWSSAIAILAYIYIAHPAFSDPIGATDIEGFVAAAEAELDILGGHAERAAFLNGVDETPEHTKMSEEASRIASDRAVALARTAAKYDASTTSDDVRRKLGLMQLAITLPPPSDPALSAELSQLISDLETNYTTAQNCTGLENCRTREALYKVMETSRDPQELRSAWNEWHSHARAIRSGYSNLVRITNEGARELGHPDTGALWRSHYDMPAQDFALEYDRLWDQVMPLYNALHCHVRAKLQEAYPALVRPDGAIPAHLLGNMWAQHWSAIDDLVGIALPEEQLDISKLLMNKGFSPRDMVRAGENFFVSIGFPKLSAAFWDRSMIVKPSDKKVNCQASAWDIDAKAGDVRLKMCTDITEQDFLTVHHELGHIYYFLNYKNQPPLFRGGANPGFHEAIGDVVARSIT